MKDTNLIIRIDEDLKNDFKKIVDENNFTVSSVVIAAIKDIVKRKRIPINYYSYLKKKKVHSMRDFAKNFVLYTLPLLSSGLKGNYARKKQLN